MSYDYGRYFCVDFAIDLYLELLKFMKTKKPYEVPREPVMIPSSPVVYSRALIGSLSAWIARTNEKVLDLESTTLKEQYENAISELMDACDFISKISPKEPMTVKDLKQQIKNALAHAEYTVKADKETGECYIAIDSPKISGCLSMGDIEELAKVYSSIYMELAKENVSYDIQELITQRANNKQCLRESIEKIKKGKFVNDIQLPFAVTIVSPIIHEGETLPDDKQEIIYDYIMYSGVQKWTALSSEKRAKIFAESLRPIIENRCESSNPGTKLFTLLDFLLHHGKRQVTTQNFEEMAFKAPSMYAGMIIDLGYLCLNHIKESHAKEELPSFNYHNISLKGINYSPKECVRIVTKDEQITKCDNQLKDLYPKLTRKKDALARKRQEIESIENSPRIPAAKKAQLLEQRKQEIIGISEELDSLSAKIYALEDKKTCAEDYVETNDFFKHLRNSISHGFYTIDYSKALKEKDLGKIMFHFEDWDISKSDRNNRKLVFAADIPASKLIEIFSELQERLLQDANSIDAQTEKVVYINDIRVHKKDDGKLEKALRRFNRRGAIVEKIS